MTEESVFAAALAIGNPAGRAEYLDGICAGNPDLRREVEELLAAHAASNPLDRPPADLIPTGAYVGDDSDGPSPSVGDHIGPYRLMEQIGEGGFGLVFVAKQQEPVRRKVALKVLKPGMDTREVIARFEAERQALALMDHPNIARVFDAGTTEQGRPYFVMELVRGIPITDYCDEHRLSPRDRLALFALVCQAVQHAHQKGIIHRDIKPSNVLVTTIDGAAVPKVIDFGVAKAVGERLTEKTVYTQFAQMIGTPLYMSPEQAELSGVDVDTRADIYALGVLLYELLTGTTPFDRERFKKAAFDEIRRIIREEEPPKPSTRLTSPKTSLRVVSARRGTAPGKLVGLVRGELDWIVMKCLEKDRNRRYDTANALARDVHRHLSGDAVEACPPTLGYRLRKIVRKNKIAITTTAVVAAALLTGIALTSWQAVRASNAERAITKERDKTNTALTDAINLGKELDTRLGELKVANDKNRSDQETMRVNQYAWDMQLMPAIVEKGNPVAVREFLERQPVHLRGFEWHYWNRITKPELASVRLLTDETGPGHLEKMITPTWAFSGDGTCLAHIQLPNSRRVSGKMKFDANVAVITVWDVSTQKVLRRHEMKCAPGAILHRFDLSYDGKRAIVRHSSSGLQTSLHVFDVDSDAVLLDQTDPKVASVNASSGAILSADGRRCIILALSRTRKPDAVGASPGNPSGSLSISVIDLDSGEKTTQEFSDVFFPEFSPDGRRLLEGGAAIFKTDAPEPAAKIFDLTTGKMQAALAGGNSCVFSPDGKEVFGVVLAAGPKSDRMLLKCWKAETGKERFAIPIPLAARKRPNPGGDDAAEPTYVPVVWIKVSRDGSRLVVASPRTGDGRNTWILIDSQNGKVLAPLENPRAEASAPIDFPTAEHSFSLDGRLCLFPQDNVIRTFDSTTGLPVHTLRGHEGEIIAAAQTPNGMLWSVEANGTLKQWNLQPGESWQFGREVKVIGMNEDGNYFVSPNGAWVGSIQTERNEQTREETKTVVRLWDCTGRLFKEFEKPGRKVSEWMIPLPFTCLSSDGRRLVLIRPAVLKNRMQNGRPIPVDPPERLASADLTVWDVGRKEVLYETELSVEPLVSGHSSTNSSMLGSASASQVRWSPDGSSLTLVLQGEKSSSLQVFDITNRRAGQPIDLGVVGSKGMQFSPDGRWLAMMAAESPKGGEQAKPLKLFLYDPAAQKGKMVDLLGSRDDVIVWSPDGTRLAVSRFDGTRTWSGLEIYDVASGFRRTLISQGVAVNQTMIIWSPDGTRLAVNYKGDNEGRIGLYDTASGKQLNSFVFGTRGTLGVSPAYPGSTLAFSSDGRRLVGVTSSRQSRSITVWETQNGKELLSISDQGLFPPTELPPRLHLAFTPDNHRVTAIVIPSGFDLSSGNPVKQDLDGKVFRVKTWDATPRPENLKKP